MSPSMTLSPDRLKYSAMSDLGMRRTKNQDAMAVLLAEDDEAWRRGGHLFAVADGMGAHAAGELASQMAVDAVGRTYRASTDIPSTEALERAVIEANARLHAQGQSHVDFRGMGTTLSTLLLLPQGAVVAHVGDSRVYRVRQERIEQLTFDHSLVWEMIEVSRISESQVPASIPKNVITRSLGPNPTVQVDLEGPYPIRSGDRYVLCSDGLTGLVSDEELGQIVTCLPSDDAARMLVDLANLRGGHDNITAIVVEVAGPPEQGEAEDEVPVPAEAPRPARPGLSRGLLGAAAAASLAASWLLARQEHRGAAAAAAAIGCVAGLLALIRRNRPSAAARARAAGMLGAGPYRLASCPLKRELVDSLAELLDGLEKVAAEVGVPIGSPECTAQRDSAAAAADEGDLPTAVERYAQAMHVCFGPLRKAWGRSVSPWSVDL